MLTRSGAPTKEPLALEVQDPAAQAGGGVAIRGLRHAYGELRTIDRLDLRARPHGVLGVVGPSGCGKSTLLELIAGLREPAAGEIEVGGARGSSERLGRCAYMPQRDLLLPWRDALGNAALALECQGEPKAAAREHAAALFERFGLADFERARPSELSGGMRQRVAFLRTLLPGRPVLLLDEPFGALDSITRSSMQEWLADALAADPRTVLLVTHDVEEAVLLADRVAVLSPRPGRVVAELEVGLPRPRRRRDALGDPAFVELVRHALDALAVSA
jgi:NitT/TauT family transport system ATP-binding protein